MAFVSPVRPAYVALAVLAATFVAPTAVAQTPQVANVDIELRIKGERIELAGNLRRTLTDRADRIVRHCGYDAGDRDDRVWRKALAEPSIIRLVYAKPVRLRLPRRTVMISQAVFSLGDPGFLGSPILRHAGRTTLVFKCDGTEMLRLMCMPKLKALFPPGYQKHCNIVRRE
jgi:hypothetical protein